MSGSILVVLQHREGRLHRMSKEVVAAGQSLAAASGVPVEAVLLGDSLDELAGAAAGFDLGSLHVVAHEALSAYTPGAWVDALEQVIEATAPSTVLLPHTYQTVDFLGLLAQRTGLALVAEATGYAVEDGRVVWQRPILSGKLQARVAVKDAACGLVSVQSGSYSADDARAGSAELLPFDLDRAPRPDREILGTEEVAGDQVDLSAAPAIVAVGRGIGDAEKMAVAEELAAALGAELAASRPVIDSGWLPRDRQIGSSGQTVAPRLYVALGISGAIQHLVGMKGSKTVVAINRDASAPIFAVADYGYVGDLHEFVPALTAAVREAAED